MEKLEYDQECVFLKPAMYHIQVAKWYAEDRRFRVMDLTFYRREMQKSKQKD